MAKNLAKALLEYETLNGDEIAIVVKGGKLNRNESASENPLKEAISSGSVPTAGGSDLGQV